MSIGNSAIACDGVPAFAKFWDMRASGNERSLGELCINEERGEVVGAQTLQSLELTERNKDYRTYMQTGSSEMTFTIAETWGEFYYPNKDYGDDSLEIEAMFPGSVYASGFTYEAIHSGASLKGEFETFLSLEIFGVSASTIVDSGIEMIGLEGISSASDSTVDGTLSDSGWSASYGSSAHIEIAVDENGSLTGDISISAKTNKVKPNGKNWTALQVSSVEIIGKAMGSKGVVVRAYAIADGFLTLADGGQTAVKAIVSLSMYSK